MILFPCLEALQAAGKEHWRVNGDKRRTVASTSVEEKNETETGTKGTWLLLVQHDYMKLERQKDCLGRVLPERSPRVSFLIFFWSCV